MKAKFNDKKNVDSIRAFFAISIPEEITSIAAQKINKSDLHASESIRWLFHNKIHITLKFIANFQSQHIESLSSMIQNAIQEFDPFSVSIRGFGTFPNIHAPRVIWVGVVNNPTLIRLASMIENITEYHGYNIERRLFSPHITIGRITRNLQSVELIALRALVQDSRKIPFKDILVDEFTLFKSMLHHTGAVHIPEKTYLLGKNR